MHDEYVLLLQHSGGTPLGFITKSRNEQNKEEYSVRDISGKVVAREGIIDRLHDEILPALQVQLETTARRVQRSYELEQGRTKGKGRDKENER